MDSKSEPTVKLWMVIVAFVVGVGATALFFNLKNTGQGTAVSSAADSSIAISATGEIGAGTSSAGASESTSAVSSSATSSADAGASSSGSANSASSSGSATQSGSMAETVAKFFPSWSASSPALAQLVSYVDEVTNPASTDYIEPEARIATFDMDGTIICEKAPVYVDYCMLLYRVYDDPGYQASPEMRSLMDKIRANADKGVVDVALDSDKGESFAKAFAGMEPKEFHAYVQNFLATVPVEGFEGMTYGQSFYKPMLEVINYLKDHDFEVYMVSACEREVVRAACVPLGIDTDHIIGSDLSMVASGQGDESALDYTFSLTDKLLTGSTVYSGCANTNKVIAIAREIGQRPVLSFGNSSGDFAMLNYAQSNPDHRGMGLFVLCDDTKREYGNDEKAASYLENVNASGWVGISMRDDWATIYGDGVKKTALRADQNVNKDAAQSTGQNDGQSVDQGAAQSGSEELAQAA